jgi:hypothetical protein
VLLGLDRSRAGVAALAVAAMAFVSAPARADDAATEAGTTTIAGPVASRPRIEIALGMGASIDDAGLRAAGLSAVPSFYATGGFGEGAFGVDLGLFANSATGRYRSPNVPVDRLGFDAMLVVRPFADFFPGDGRYRMRVLRAVALDLGLSYERDSRLAPGPEEVDRFGSRVGVHIDVPLTPAEARSELRLRLTARRFVSASNVVFPGGDPAPDTHGELFAALAAVF